MGQFSGGTRKIWKGGQNSIANLGDRSWEGEGVF